MLGLFDVHWSLYIQVFHGDAIMGQTIILISENQRDCFTNDTFRGRSLVSSAVYYEVAPQVVFRCVVVILGVLQLALREQQRRPGQPGPEASIPDHQDASGDADSHI
ncbi:hypothetical protein Tco_1067038 [Tanacetum coccineum]|uniref:Uncharacterized protein n=1 Tax=Tanacetum coccineum TaxID=301880 RepID=A0ABQ5HBR7_9ASTR